MSDFLNITRNKHNNSFKIYSNNHFLRDNKEVVFSSDEWGFKIRVPNIDDDGVINTISRNGDSSYFLNVRCEHMSIGKVEIDQEESNQDVLVIIY